MAHRIGRYIQQVTTGILSAKQVITLEHTQMSTPPLRPEARLMNYVRQNNGGKITVRQARQIRRMTKRNSTVQA